MTVDNREQLRNRINDCQIVLNELEQSNAWNVVLNDANLWVKQLDDRWQDVADEKQLREMRVLKMAYKYLLDIRIKYKNDMENAKTELMRLENPDKYIQKDYDEETNLE